MSSKAKILLRVDAEPEFINQMLRKYTDFLNISIQKLGISLFFEPMETGVVMIFQDEGDFDQFHRIMRELSTEKDVDLNIAENQAYNAIIAQFSSIGVKLTFHIEVHGSTRPLELYYHQIEDTYRLISHELEVHKHDSNGITLKYPNMQMFVRLTRLIMRYFETHGY